MTVVYAVLRLIGWRGAIAIAILLAGAWWHLSRVSDAREAGAQSVRLEWQEANRRAELKAIERQKQRQDEIAKIEAELMTTQTQAAMRRRALENALEDERANDGNPAVDRRACTLPDRVRDALRYREP